MLPLDYGSFPWDLFIDVLRFINWQIEPISWLKAVYFHVYCPILFHEVRVNEDLHTYL